MMMMMMMTMMMMMMMMNPHSQAFQCWLKTGSNAAPFVAQKLVPS